MASKLHIDYLMHRKHKYIAKIGEGVKAKYFYTQEALDAYKKALSSKDEKAVLDTAKNNYNKAANEYNNAAERQNAANDRIRDAGALDFKERNEAKKERDKAYEDRKTAQTKMLKETENLTNAQVNYMWSKKPIGKISDVVSTHEMLKETKDQRKAAAKAKAKGGPEDTDNVKKADTSKNDNTTKPIDNETDRVVDRVKYEAKTAEIGEKAQKRIADTEQKYGSESVRTYAAAGRGLAEISANELMKALNETGNGKTDDAIVNAVKKGEDFLRRLGMKR